MDVEIKERNLGGAEGWKNRGKTQRKITAWLRDCETFVWGGRAFEPWRGNGAYALHLATALSESRWEVFKQLLTDPIFHTNGCRKALQTVPLFPIAKVCCARQSVCDKPVQRVQNLNRRQPLRACPLSFNAYHQGVCLKPSRALTVSVRVPSRLPWRI